MAEAPDRRSRIAESLREVFDPVHCEVVDDSHLHAGHAGASSGGGHFCIVVVSDRFEGRSLLERQRLVFGALSGERSLDNILSLSMKTLTPEEWRG